MPASRHGPFGAGTCAGGRRLVRAPSLPSPIHVALPPCSCNHVIASTAAGIVHRHARHDDDAQQHRHVEGGIAGASNAKAQRVKRHRTGPGAGIPPPAAAGPEARRRQSAPTIRRRSCQYAKDPSAQLPKPPIIHRRTCRSPRTRTYCGGPRGAGNCARSRSTGGRHRPILTAMEATVLRSESHAKRQWGANRHA